MWGMNPPMTEFLDLIPEPDICYNRLDGSTARRLDGSTARRLDGFMSRAREVV